MLATLIQIDGYDPVAAAAVTLRYANVDDPAVCMLNGQTWWPAIAKAPSFAYDLFDGAFGNGITAPTTSCKVQVEPFPLLPRYQLGGARVQVWTGEAGNPWSGYTLRLDGRAAGQPQVENGQAEIELTVDDSWLDTPLLTTYGGSGGADGPDDLRGTTKPLAIGAPRYISGVLIDSINSVFQLSSYGAINAVEVALERLVRFSTGVGDYASYAALVAATIPPGKWATSLAAGLVRFGAPTQGQISFLAQGDAAGPDGWVRLPGRIINRLALLAGGAGKIDTASLTALDTARPYNLSLYLDDQVTAREIIQRIAASINAVAGISWLGKLFVAPVGIGASTLTLNADGSTLPPVASTKQAKLAPPFWRLAIQSERTWTVHALSDVALASALYDTSNMIPVPDDPTGWQLTAGATYASPGVSRPAALNAAKLDGAAEVVYWSKDLDIPCVPGQQLWFSHTVYADGACLTGSEQVRGGIRCFTAEGALIGNYPIMATAISVSDSQAAAGWATKVGSIATPAGAAFVCPYSTRLAATSGAMYVGEPRLTPHEPSSDVTRVIQLSAAAAAVHLDASGDPVDGQLPITFRASLIRGGVDVSPQTIFAITATTTVTATINDTPGSADRGVITLTDVAADGIIRVTATNDGVLRTTTISIDAQQEAVPSAPNTASQTVFPSISSSTYDNPAAAFAVPAGGGAHSWSFTGSYRVAVGSCALAAKAQYRTAGSGTWTDAAVESTGSPAYSAAGESEDGYISGGGTVSGLTGSIEWRLLERRLSGTTTTRLVGSFRATSS